MEDKPIPKPLEPKVLETLVDYSISNFRTHLIDVRSIQLDLLKTYLWISSFLITIQLGVFQYFKPEQQSKFYFIPFSLGLISLALSLVIFSYSILNLRMPNRKTFFIEDPEVTFAVCEPSYYQCIRAFIYNLEDTTKQNMKADNDTGCKIRKMAHPLVISVFFMVLSAISFYLLNL